MHCAVRFEEKLILIDLAACPFYDYLWVNGGKPLSSQYR